MENKPSLKLYAYLNKSDGFFDVQVVNTNNIVPTFVETKS